MPFGFHTKHSNRSQQLLENPQSVQQGSSSSSLSSPQQQASVQAQAPAPAPQQPSPGHSASSSLRSRGEEEPIRERSVRPQSYGNPRNDMHAYGPPLRTNTFQGIENVAYHQNPESPSRSYSQHPGPPISLNTSIRPDINSAPGDLQDYYQTTPYSPAQQYPQEQLPVAEQKKSKSRFFGFAKSRETSHSASPSTSSHNNTTGLARRISKRQSDGYPVRNSYHQAYAADPRIAQPVQLQQPPPLQAGWPARSSDSLPTSSSQADDEKAAFEYHTQRQHDGSNQEHYPTTRQLPNASQRLDRDSTLRIVDPNSAEQNYTVATPRLQTQPPDNYQQQSPYQQSPQDNTQYQPRSRQQSINPNQGLSPLIVPNIESVSPVSHASPIDPRDEQRPGTSQSTSRLSVLNTSNEEYIPREPTRQSSGPSPLGQQAPMAPPGQQAPARRPVEQKSSMQGESRDNGPPPPGYRSQGQMAHMQQGGQQGSNYRGGPPQREQFTSATSSDQGRSTPPPTADGKDAEAFKELLAKYKKVKGLYFEKTSQVEQLQNTLANQRLSQSRTSLDDSDYTTRFNRLDGAVSNLAFNIRKDWSSIPQWLVPYVTADALKKGTKEMTAVGRAFISRWLLDNIFDRVFHPGLEMHLSAQLKMIEQNIRMNCALPSSQEDSEALTTKVVHWRLTTLEGLADILHSAQADENKQDFLQIAASNMTASLLDHLNESVGEDAVKGSVIGIIELAVGIAANVPLESRDLVISYTLPGDPITQYMKVEPPLPPLDDPPGEGEIGESKEGAADDTKSEKTRRDRAKGGMLSTISAGPSSRKPSLTSSDDAKRDDSSRVRYAGFLNVEVRGRQVLVKPTVWAIA